MTQEVRLPDEAYEIAAVTARAVGREYRGVVELADLRQEALLWCVKHHHRVWKLLDPEEENEQDTGEARLALDLRRLLERHCRREKAQKYGYEPEDESFYDSGLLSEILEYVFSYEDWQSNPVQGDKVMSGKDPAEGGNWTASCADVSRAITRLDNMDQFFLRLKFEQHKTLREIGKAFDRSHEWARVQVETAKDRLVDELGGESPWKPSEGSSV